MINWKEGNQEIVYFARAARFPALFLAWLLFVLLGCIFGVLDEIFLLGRQYSFLSLLLPHGLPVFVFFHFSACHRFKFFPASPFRT